MSSSNANTAVAFVHLSADNGAFESANVLTTPAPFAPISLSRAQDLAKGALANGETLTGGTLTWNPRARTAFASSPNEPYFEFGVAGSKGSSVRVRLNDGAVERQ